MTLKFKYMQNFSISLKIYYSVLTDAVFDLWGLILALFSENCKNYIATALEGMTKCLVTLYILWEWNAKRKSKASCKSIQ